MQTPTRRARSTPSVADVTLGTYIRASVRLQEERHVPHVCPSTRRAERVADGCIHVTGVAFSLLATAAMMTACRKVAAGSVDGQPGRLRLRHGGGVRLLRRLQSRHRRPHEGHPAPLRSRRHLRQDRRHLHAVRVRQDGRRGGSGAAGRGVGHHRLRRHRQAAVAGASRADVLRALSRPGLGHRGGVRLARADHLEPGADPARGRRLPLYRRRRLPSLGEAALPQRHLARVRAGRFGLSFRRHRRRPRPHLRRASARQVERTIIGALCLSRCSRNGFRPQRGRLLAPRPPSRPTRRKEQWGRRTAQQFRTRSCRR